MLLFVFSRRLACIDSPPIRQVLGNEDDADRAPDVGNSIGERDHRRRLLWRAARRQFDGTGSHRLFGGSDGRRHGLGAREHPARCARRQLENPCTDHNDCETDNAGDNGENGVPDPVGPQTIEEGGPDSQPDTVHKQIVEQALGEVVELELLAIGGRPDRQAATNNDRGCDHAKSISSDGLSSDPHGKAHRDEQEDVGICGQEVEESLHGGSPQPFALAVMASALSNLRPRARS